MPIALSRSNKSSNNKPSFQPIRMPYNWSNNKSFDKPTKIPYDLSNNKPISQSQSPSMMDSVKTGMGFGFGSSVGHSVFNGLFGGKAEEKKTEIKPDEDTSCKDMKSDLDKCLNRSKECTMDDMKYLMNALDKCNKI
jgi:hypothetical protein